MYFLILKKWEIKNVDKTFYYYYYYWIFFCCEREIVREQRIFYSPSLPFNYYFIVMI